MDHYVKTNKTRLPLINTV